MAIRSFVIGLTEIKRRSINVIQDNSTRKLKYDVKFIFYEIGYSCI